MERVPVHGPLTPNHLLIIMRRCCTLCGNQFRVGQVWCARKGWNGREPVHRACAVESSLPIYVWRGRLTEEWRGQVAIA